VTDVRPDTHGAAWRAPLLAKAKARYGIVERDGRLELPESVRGFFLGEQSVEAPAGGGGAGSDFFWHRLAEHVTVTEPMFYRASLPAPSIPPDLQEIVSTDPLLLIWVRGQFEAHRLIEHPLAVAISKDRAIKVSLDLFSDEGPLTPAKIYLTEEELAARMTLLRGALPVLMNREIVEIQATMLRTLGEETQRIREYYSHLLVKTVKHEEKERLRQEQHFLEVEHRRRLHPGALRILVVPEVIVALSIEV